MYRYIERSIYRYVALSIYQYMETIDTISNTNDKSSADKMIPAVYSSTSRCPHQTEPTERLRNTAATKMPCTPDEMHR